MTTLKQRLSEHGNIVDYFVQVKRQCVCCTDYYVHALFVDCQSSLVSLRYNVFRTWDVIDYGIDADFDSLELDCDDIKVCNTLDYEKLNEIYNKVDYAVRLEIDRLRYYRDVTRWSNSEQVIQVYNKNES